MRFAAFRKRFADRGIKVTVQAGQMAQVDAKVIEPK